MNLSQIPVNVLFENVEDLEERQLLKRMEDRVIDWGATKINKAIDPITKLNKSINKRRLLPNKFNHKLSGINTDTGPSFPASSPSSSSNAFSAAAGS